MQVSSEQQYAKATLNFLMPCDVLCKLSSKSFSVGKKSPFFSILISAALPAQLY